MPFIPGRGGATLWDLGGFWLLAKVDSVETFRDAQVDVFVKSGIR